MTINQVVPVEGSGRRLLGVSDDSVDVHATVSGAVSMRHLPQHLEARAPSLHIKHVVKHEHVVHAMPHSKKT